MCVAASVIRVCHTYTQAWPNRSHFVDAINYLCNPISIGRSETNKQQRIILIKHRPRQMIRKYPTVAQSTVATTVSPNRQRTVHFWRLQSRPLSLMHKWLIQVATAPFSTDKWFTSRSKIDGYIFYRCRTYLVCVETKLFGKISNYHEKSDCWCFGLKIQPSIYFQLFDRRIQFLRCLCSKMQLLIADKCDLRAVFDEKKSINPS